MSEVAESKTSDNKNIQDTAEVEKKEVEPEDKWMIRDCDTYDDEYDECTSIKGRFHQMFIFGEPLNCNQWKKDYENCCKWRDDKDIKAANALIESEKSRRLERLKAHYRNDIWEKRDCPPPDWDRPLPEWMVKRDENTYLALKAKEIREGKDTDDKKSSCSIM